MKAKQQSKALEGIKKEQLKRRNFTLEFKAEVVRYKKAENLTWAECSRQFDVLPKLVQVQSRPIDGRGVSPSSETGAGGNHPPTR